MPLMDDIKNEALKIRAKVTRSVLKLLGAAPAGDELTIRPDDTFLGWHMDDATIRSAVEMSRADKMRKAESALKDGTRKDIPFVRKASTGQWREVFDQELNDLYWQRFGPLMERFGYPKR